MNTFPFMFWFVLQALCVLITWASCEHPATAAPESAANGTDMRSDQVRAYIHKPPESERALNELFKKREQLI